MNELGIETLENWRAFLEINGGKENALPLPGCLVEGEIDGKLVTLSNAYFDLTNQLVTNNFDDEKAETYKLGVANENYIKMLNEFIDWAKAQELKKGKEIGE